MRGQRHSEGEAVVDAAMALGKANGQRPKRTSWLPDGQQLCQLAVGCNDVATLQALASKFLSIISAEVESCLSRKKGPRATIRLCSLLKSFLIHLHMRPSQLKAFTRPRYEDLVAALLSYYIDLSFEVSNANASVAFLSNVVTTVNLALGHSPRHIVETLLQLKKDPTEKWDELYPLLKRVMANSSPITQSPSDFMKTIVLIKQWLNYGSTQHHRRIRKLCVSLTPPAGLDEWLGSHGFKQLSTGLKEPSVSVGEYLLSDQLTAKGCTRLLDMVCNTEDASLLSPPSFPSVAHAPKASEPPPCFFVLDTQPDRQALMEDSVPTGDDNCEQLYRALDSTIEAMDLDTGWRFGLGDGDMDDDADFCPLQFHLDNSIEQNGFDVTPPKNEPSRSSPEEGKLALGIEMNVGEAMTEDAQSRSVLSPSVIKSSDRSRRKSNISSRSADANPEPASQSSLAQRSGPGSSQKPDVSSKPGCLDCDKSPSVCHSTKRSGRRKSSVLDADEGIGLTSTEDVVRELFSSRGEQRRRRTSSHLSEETGSSEVKEVVVSSPRRNKNIDCQKLNRKGNDVLPESAAQSSKPSRKSLDTGRKSDYCNTSVRTYTETTANDPPPRSNNVRRKSASNQPTSDDIRSPAQSPSDRKTTRRKRSTDSSIGSGSPQKAVAKRSNGVTLRLSKKMRSLSPIRPFGESKSPIFPSGGSKSPVLSSGELKSKFSDKEDLIASTNSLVLRNKGRRKRDADSSGLPDPSSSQKLAQLCARVSPLPKKAKHSMTNSNSPQNKEPQVTTPRRSLQPSAKLELNASPSIKQTVSSRNLQCSTTSPRKRTDSPSDQDSGLLVRSVVTKRRSQEVVGKAASVSPRRTAKISSKQSPSKTPTAPSGRIAKVRRHPKTSPPKIISNFSLRQKYRLRSRQQLKR